MSGALPGLVDRAPAHRARGLPEGRRARYAAAPQTRADKIAAILCGRRGRRPPLRVLLAERSVALRFAVDRAPRLLQRVARLVKQYRGEEPAHYPRVDPHALPGHIQLGLAHPLPTTDFHPPRTPITSLPSSTPLSRPRAISRDPLPRARLPGVETGRAVRRRESTLRLVDRRAEPDRI